MAIYSIEDKTLTALGDAVRNKVIGENLIFNYRTVFNNISRTTLLSPAFQEVYHSPKWRITFHNVEVIEVIGTEAPKLSWASGGSGTHYDLLASGALPLTVITQYHGYFYPSNIKCNIDFSIECVDENGEPYKYSPGEMIEKINNLTILPESQLNITGNCNYRFAFNTNNWMIELYGDKVQTNDITNMNQCFYNSDKLQEIPFDINFKLTSNSAEIFSKSFEGATSLKKYPNIYIDSNNISKFIFGQGANQEKNIFWNEDTKLSGFNYESFKNYLFDVEPTWIFDECDWSGPHNDNAIFGTLLPVDWNNSHYIKELPSFPKFYNVGGSGVYYTPWYQLDLAHCYSLKGIVLPRPGPQTLTSSPSGFRGINNVLTFKHLKFDIQEDGSVYTAQWKNTTFDLTDGVGYIAATYYNSYLDSSKRVKDDITYQALKNDDEYWTNDIKYSGYNHDSAVETINTLPDTSAYGTNTIKFKGSAGSATDGGAINTLTAEEIAVATAKGWTVSLV